MKPKKFNVVKVLGGMSVIYVIIAVMLEIATAAMKADKRISFISALSQVGARISKEGIGAFTPFNQQAFVQYLGIFTLFYVLICTYIIIQEKMKLRDVIGNEAGSAEWNNDLDGYNKKYTFPYGSPKRAYEENTILTDDVFMGLDGRKTQRNLNTLVIGGSGAGKSRFYVKPNILQAGYADTSFVVTDPSGELLESCGKFLKDKGYKVQVLNLTDMRHSFCYNPFDYIREPEDILILINCLIKNTTPPGQHGGDPFFEKAETALLQAIFFFLWEQRPPEDRNFSSVMQLLRAANVDENNSSGKTPLDNIFDEIGKNDPDNMGYKSYQTFRMGSGKTLKSILISAAVRLNAFEIPAVANMVNHDYKHPEKNIDLTKVGEEKTALFCIIPSADDTYNFIVAMMYYQLFSTLYYSYDHDKKPLKYPVRFMLDEFANIGQIPDFDKKLATMRKYKISCAIILQNLKQLEEMYDKKAEPLIGNCDEILFLGSSEASTLEYISKKLGKTTVRSRGTSSSKSSSSGSVSKSINQTGRELLTPDEVGLIKTTDCILFVRGEKPFFGPKYVYDNHPNYKYTADASSDNAYDLNEVFEEMEANYEDEEEEQVIVTGDAAVSGAQDKKIEEEELNANARNNATKKAEAIDVFDAKKTRETNKSEKENVRRRTSERRNSSSQAKESEEKLEQDKVALDKAAAQKTSLQNEKINRSIEESNQNEVRLEKDNQLEKDRQVVKNTENVRKEAQKEIQKENKRVEVKKESLAEKLVVKSKAEEKREMLKSIPKSQSVSLEDEYVEVSLKKTKTDTASSESESLAADDFKSDYSAAPSPFDSDSSQDAFGDEFEEGDMSDAWDKELDDF